MTRDAEAKAALAEVTRILRAARRPRCWRCRELMDRDVSGRYWHGTIPGCRASLLSVGTTPPWEPQEEG